MMVDDLPAVDLSELTGTAELLTRHDRKYLVAGLLPVRALTTGARVLEIDGLREFTYASSYFDTDDSASHRSAAHGRRRRFKVRLRHYVDSGHTVLEVKTRERRGMSAKERLPLISAIDPDRPHLDARARQELAERLAQARVSGVDVEDLRHVLTTHYRRRTLLLPDGARLTLDAGLRWSTPDGRGLATSGLTVVETKAADGQLSPADRALWRAGCRPVRFSKYACGRGLLDPHLPTNRWHRTLHRDLPAVLLADLENSR